MADTIAQDLCPIFRNTNTLKFEQPILCGSSSSFVTTTTAGKKFLQYYIENTASSGDNRGMYLRLKLSGGGGGESLRVFTNVEANAGTCHGSHVSLNFVATAGGSECSGLGVASRNTLHIPNVASWAPTGTYAAGMFEIYSDGSNSDPAGMTELSVLRLCNSGDATGAADVDDDACIFSIQGFTAAGDTTSAISSTSLAEFPSNSIALRIKVGATSYHIPAVISTELN